MNFTKGKKIAAAVGAAVAVVAGSGVAYAYFTTTGSGTGSGSVGTSSALTLRQASITYSNSATDKALVPGTSADVTWTVDNPSSGHQYLSTISLASVTSDKTGCDSATHPGWFTMPAVTVGTDYAPGSGQAVKGTGTITFNNDSVTQDVCKDAALTFAFTSN